jgi:hypothetical protein
MAIFDLFLDDYLITSGFWHRCAHSHRTESLRPSPISLNKYGVRARDRIWSPNAVIVDNVKKNIFILVRASNSGRPNGWLVICHCTI